MSDKRPKTVLILLDEAVRIIRSEGLAPNDLGYRKLSAIAGVSHGTVNRWFDNESPTTPRAAALEKLMVFVEQNRHKLSKKTAKEAAAEQLFQKLGGVLLMAGEGHGEKGEKSLAQRVETLEEQNQQLMALNRELLTRFKIVQDNFSKMDDWLKVSLDAVDLGKDVE